MANPQAENGHTRIANELLEAIIRFGFSKREFQVLLAVIRKTYGYGKKEDDLGITQLAKMTGLQHTHAAKAVRDLIQMGVLYRKEGGFAHVLGLVKDYSKWRVTESVTMTKTVIVRGDQNSHRRVTKTVTPPLTKTVTTKENHPKENPKRKIYIPPPQIDLGNDDSETSGKSGGGVLGNDELGNLIFPASLSRKEQQAAAQMLVKVNGSAQEILDALEAAIRAGQVSKSPLSLLGGIVRRYEAGTFDPAPGLHIAIERRKKMANERQATSPVDGEAVLRNLEQLRELQKARTDPQANNTINAGDAAGHIVKSGDGRRRISKLQRKL